MVSEGAQHYIVGDQDYELYGEQQEAPPAWVPQPECGPTGFDSDQLKQLYRQLNHHCQLMIQVYALTAPNSHNQETAQSVRELLEHYQVMRYVDQ